ncbi:hypothetical protein FQA39_LY10378 [Lamprigera yunnana]|nr:hypothetical protein FQA39_LY10378 [Lamprigera yunnana]
MLFYLIRTTLLYLTLLISHTVPLSNSLSQNVIINLSNRNKDNEVQTVFVSELSITEGNVVIDVINATSDNGFFVIQAHSFLSNVSLSKYEQLKLGTYVSGTNVGMVENPVMRNTNYRYYIGYVETPNVDVLLAVTVYTEKDINYDLTQLFMTPSYKETQPNHLSYYYYEHSAHGPLRLVISTIVQAHINEPHNHKIFIKNKQLIDLINHILQLYGSINLRLNFCQISTHFESYLKIFLCKIDPIPGGCNMVYSTRHAPYQIVTWDENMIKIDATPALASSCDVPSLPRLDMYHMYIDEETLDKYMYFNGIQNFLTVDNIKTYGRKVSDSVKHLPLRRYYSAYRGTGSVFGIIATDGNASTAYVPAVTYACDITNWNESCLGPVSIPWKLLCAVILFMGIFIGYFGHRFFRTELFLFGFIFGSFVFYIASNLTIYVDVEQTLGYSIIFGCLYGICWFLLWWRYGIPILSVSLPMIIVGYILACIVFHTGLADFYIFRSDLNYYGVLFCIITVVTMCLLMFAEFANILACSIIGATAVIIAIDHYAGAAIHYIILNNIRRAIVPSFNLAILDPPFQFKDIILSVAWVGLVLFGVILQRIQQRGKPPFPPHRMISRNASERTPLLVSTTRYTYLRF